MKRFGNLVKIFTFSFLVLGMVTIASAQNRDDDDNGSYRNGRIDPRDDQYGTYGQRGNDQYGTYNYGQLRSAVERLRNRSKDFDKRLGREFDRNRNYGGYAGSRILQLSENFKNAAKDLKDNFNNNRNSGRRSNDAYYAQQVVNLGSQLDREVYRMRLSSKLQDDWYSIQQDLRIVSNAYGINYNNRGTGGWGRGTGNRNGDWRSKVPFPLPF
jgi:hypothetical protein